MFLLPTVTLNNICCGTEAKSSLFLEFRKLRISVHFGKSNHLLCVFSSSIKLNRKFFLQTKVFVACTQVHTGTEDASTKSKSVSKLWTLGTDHPT